MRIEVEDRLLNVAGPVKVIDKQGNIWVISERDAGLGVAVGNGVVLVNPRAGGVLHLFARRFGWPHVEGSD